MKCCQSIRNWISHFSRDNYQSNLVKRLSRLKIYNEYDDTDDDNDKNTTKVTTALKRCLTTFDLTALGVGSTLGAGVYVLTGQVAHQSAGPSIILAMTIAALASALAGLCYAEFSARVSKTGSAYLYSYVTVGELIAFIVGWNLILEYAIGVASVARAWSANFDLLINNVISKYFLQHFHWNAPGLAPYPDFMALAIVLLFTIILSVGVKVSSSVNNIFTVINLMVILFVFGCGMFYADIKNWSIPKSSLPHPGPYPLQGDGGFTPYGLAGLLTGAATCFFAFVGFDSICSTSEEVHNPRRSVPLSIIFTLLICFISYFCTSMVITLMIPYYEVNPNAPLPDAFNSKGITAASYIISIGAICGLSTAIVGSMFPLPRIILAMARDGLVFRQFSNINKKLKTPLAATILSGLLCGIMTTIFDISALVNMMSIGALLAYILVSISVLILRYQPDNYISTDDNLIAGQQDNQIELVANAKGEMDEEVELNESSNVANNYGSLKAKRSIDISNQNQSCTTVNANTDINGDANETNNLYNSGKVVIKCVAMLTIVIVAVCCILIKLSEELSQGVWWAILFLCCTIALMIILSIIIIRQPQNQQQLKFKAPLVPYLPILSIFVNIFLMIKLPPATWIRFGIWMAIGFCIYFGYGMWHSTEERQIHTIRRLSLEDAESDIYMTIKME